MKKHLCTLLIFVLVLSFSVTSYASTMYSLDGRTEEVSLNLVDSYKNVGWYETPVTILYAGDGRSIVVAQSDAQIWKNVGWSETASSVLYTNMLDDRSVYDTDGVTLGEHYYRKYRVCGNSYVANKINSYIEDDARAFFRTNDGEVSFRDGINSEIEYYGKNNLRQYPYCNKSDASVTKNEDGIFSIKKTYSWFCGGTASADDCGLTFNLYSGEKLSIFDFLGYNSSMIKDRIIYSLKHNYDTSGFWDDYQTIIYNKYVGDMDFYVSGNTIYVCFPKYELACGAAGCIEAPISRY